MFFVSVALAGWLAGRLPGLLSVALSALVANYLFLEPYDALSLTHAGLTATAMFLLSGAAVTLLCASFRDAQLELQDAITDQKRAHEQLRYQRDLNHAITESAADAIFVMDEAGLVQLANPEAERVFGFSFEELRGRSFHDLLHHHHPDGRPFPASECELARVHKGGACMRDFETVYFRKDGSPVQVVCSTGALVVGGQRIGAALVARDVTAQKAAAAERERLLEALEERDRRKDEFLATLSHELRNPLAPITNSLYVLQRATPGSTQAARAIAVIGRQTHQMTRLIGDLLDVTRVARDKLQLQKERLDLHELVRRVVEDHRDLFLSAGVELNLKAVAGELPVLGDRTRITQMVGNLLQNASKYTQRGGVTTVSLQRDGEHHAVIRVADNGCGIPADLLPRMFEPFAQGDTTLDRSKGGLGLGLAVVKGLAQLHGGSAAVRSDGPGKGAEFTLRLPLAGIPEEQAAVPIREGSGARRIPRRVLIVEDNVDSADSLREALELGGHTVEVAHDGLAGIAMAAAFRPEFVICDIGLPGVDGYEVARRLRRDAGFEATRLVALTGYANPDDMRRSQAAGFDYHLAKPPKLDQLELLLSGDRRKDDEPQRRAADGRSGP